jgi:HPt (histidine-containing phosphotransfer) domain-containing protein
VSFSDEPITLNPLIWDEMKKIMKNQKETEKNRIKKDPSSLDESGEDPSPNKSVFDRDGLLYRLMGDNELVEEIADDFLNQIPINMEALKKSLDKKDALQVKREAHIIKGSAGNVGALVLQDIAKKIESAGESEDLNRAESYFMQFLAELEVFKNELDRLFR